MKQIFNGYHAKELVKVLDENLDPTDPTFQDAVLMLAVSLVDPDHDHIVANEGGLPHRQGISLQDQNDRKKYRAGVPILPVET